MSARPWFREPMLALVIGLPAAAVVAGIATVVIAARSSGDTGDPRVTRVAQVQTTDLVMDRAAARSRLSAVATIAPDGVVSLTPAAGPWPASTLRLTLRHGTDAARDRELLLTRADGVVHVGVLPGPLPAGAYNAELVPAEGGWRLVGRLEDGGTGLRLEPAVAAP
jgi:hypothetical protein